MTNNIKTAFVGCGNIAHVHMRFMRKIERSVVSVCDSSSVRAEGFAQKYSIESSYTDIDTMLTNESPDVVHLLTPPHTHYPLILKLIASGCHVLVEKPFCETEEQSKAIFAAAVEKGVQVSVDHTRVLHPMVVSARDLINSGEFGDLVRIEYDYDDPCLVKTKAGVAGYRWAKGSPAWIERIRGGILSDLLPHPLSVALSFAPDLTVRHVSSKLLGDNLIEELIVLLGSSKVDSVIKLSLNSKPLKNTLQLFCQRGSIRIDFRNMNMVILPERQMPNIVSRVVNSISETGQSFFGFVFSVFKVIAGKAHPYDGLGDIFQSFYKDVLNGKSGNNLLMNTAPVMALTEDILSQAVPGWSPTPKDPAGIYSERVSASADCLVIGGTGFIGRTLVESLCAKGESVRVFCRSAGSVERLPAETSLAFGDVRDPASLARALSGIKTVYHCAAAMSGDWAEFYESTVLGTQNLLECVVGSTVEKVIYISSLGVLDYNLLHDGSVVTEDSLLERHPDDRGFYTRAKKEAESLITKFSAEQANIKLIIIRPGLVYGKESNNNLQNSGVLLGKYLFVFGLGSRYLGLSYVRNLACAIIKSAEVNLASGIILHAIETSQPTVKEIIKLHNLYSEKKVFPIYIPIIIWKTVFFVVDKLLTFKNRKRSTLSYRFASNSKTLTYENKLLLDRLGFEPPVDIDKSFQEIYR